MSKYINWLPVIIIGWICLTFIFMTWIAGNLKVDGKKCNYVQVSYAWQISAEGCSPDR